MFVPARIITEPFCFVVSQIFRKTSYSQNVGGAECHTNGGTSENDMNIPERSEPINRTDRPSVSENCDVRFAKKWSCRVVWPESNRSHVVSAAGGDGSHLIGWFCGGWLFK